MIDLVEKIGKICHQDYTLPTRLDEIKCTFRIINITCLFIRSIRNSRIIYSAFYREFIVSRIKQKRISLVDTSIYVGTISYLSRFFLPAI